jgi:hypothetical protein
MPSPGLRNKQNFCHFFRSHLFAALLLFLSQKNVVSDYHATAAGPENRHLSVKKTAQAGHRCCGFVNTETPLCRVAVDETTSA